VETSPPTHTQTNTNTSARSTREMVTQRNVTRAEELRGYAGQQRNETKKSGDGQPPSTLNQAGVGLEEIKKGGKTKQTERKTRSQPFASFRGVAEGDSSPHRHHHKWPDKGGGKKGNGEVKAEGWK
jgi:hypothetical protein